MMDNNYCISEGCVMVEVIGYFNDVGFFTSIKRIDTQEQFLVEGFYGEVGTTYAHKFCEDGQPSKIAKDMVITIEWGKKKKKWWWQK